MIVVLIILLLISLIVFFAGWYVHRYMTIEHRAIESWHYATFPEFWKLFNEHEWERDKNFQWSFFTPRKNWNYVEEHDANYIHAGIVCIDNIGLVLYPWSFINYNIFLFTNKYKINKYKRV